MYVCKIWHCGAHNTVVLAVLVRAHSRERASRQPCRALHHMDTSIQPVLIHSTLNRSVQPSFASIKVLKPSSRSVRNVACGCQPSLHQLPIGPSTLTTNPHGYGLRWQSGRPIKIMPGPVAQQTLRWKRLVSSGNIRTGPN